METNWDTFTMVQGGRGVPAEIFRHALMEQAVAEKKVVTSIAHSGHGKRDKVEEALSEISGLQKVTEMESPIEGHQAFFITPTSTISVNFSDDDDISVHIDTIAREEFKELDKVLGEMISERPPQGQVMMLAREGSLYLNSLGRISDPLMRVNYTEEQLVAYDGLIEDLRTDSPSGRIALLDGAPGTGKSYFIRGLITDIEALFVFVPASIMGEITGPDIMSVLLAERYRDVPIVLIMEDADASLATRQMDNVSRLSDILNISDGILGDLADIRILATTNQKKADIDPAILRAGRMSYHVTFELLHKEHIDAVLQEMTGKAVAFTTPMSLADVYKLARANGWKPTPKRKAKRRNRGSMGDWQASLGIY